MKILSFQDNNEYCRTVDNKKGRLKTDLFQEQLSYPAKLVNFAIY